MKTKILIRWAIRCVGIPVFIPFVLVEATGLLAGIVAEALSKPILRALRWTYSK